MTLAKIGFLEFGLLDLLDIIIVAYILYRFILMMRGTRALTMIIGLGLILFFAFLATWLNLNSLKWLVARLGTIWLIAFLVVFQPELRGILIRVGNIPFFRRIFSTEGKKIANDIVDTVRLLSDAKVGALIAIKREVGLRNYEETGKKIDSKVTPELLTTIFTPRTPLHDGAVIIENDRIVAAGCELPLTKNPRYQKILGMRHRAGVGLSEETDAVVVLVSEETGGISMAIRGNLRRNLNVKTLRRLLEVSLESKKVDID